MSAATYTTRQGDTWDMIALRTMGAERYMAQLLDANPVYNYTAIFSAGTVLVVPALPDPVLPATLPPWRRP